MEPKGATRLVAPVAEDDAFMRALEPFEQDIEEAVDEDLDCEGRWSPGCSEAAKVTE